MQSLGRTLGRDIDERPTSLASTPTSTTNLWCKDCKTAGRTKGVRHTCPEPLKGRGEVRYFAPKGTQGKGGVGKKSKAEGLSAGDSLESDWSARPEVRGAQDEGNESGIR